MATPFLKMHGLGNDFVVLDGRAAPLALSPDRLRALADRRRGIGCDQVVLIEPGRGEAAARLRFWNPDGGESGACGNGTRCAADLLLAETGRNALLIETTRGLLACRRVGAAIEVDMGAPRLDWQDIPLAERMDTRRLDIKLGPIDAPVLHGPAAVNMGNPHCIFFVDDAMAHDLARFGPLVEHHPLFPEHANVSLAQVTAREAIRLRVWERGAGMTEACGSAACAVVVAAVRRGLSDRRARVTLDGGTLDILWRAEDDHVLMTGPTALAFRGTVDLDALSGAPREPAP